jgi:hypothetical protein
MQRGGIIHEADVVVFGAGPAGIAAAVTAAHCRRAAARALKRPAERPSLYDPSSASAAALAWPRVTARPMSASTVSKLSRHFSTFSSRLA